MDDKLKQEIERQTRVRGAIVITVNTPGWSHIKQLALRIISLSINQALEEEDQNKRDAKTLKASALKKGFEDLFSTLEQIKAYDPNVVNEDDTELGELEQEFEEIT